MGQTLKHTIKGLLKQRFNVFQSMSGVLVVEKSTKWSNDAGCIFCVTDLCQTFLEKDDPCKRGNEVDSNGTSVKELRSYLYRRRLKGITPLEIQCISKFLSVWTTF